MELTDYTTYAEVRAVMGVSDIELPDSQLELPLYLTKLQADLDSIDDRINGLYENLLEGDEDALDPGEMKFIRAVQVFAPYAVGRGASSFVSMSGLKRIEDGKAKAERFANSFGDMLQGIVSEYYKWRAHLVEMFTALGYEVAPLPPRVWTSVVTPAYNPVTGEGSE